MRDRYHVTWSSTFDIYIDFKCLFGHSEVNRLELQPDLLYCPAPTARSVIGQKIMTHPHLSYRSYTYGLTSTPHTQPISRRLGEYLSYRSYIYGLTSSPCRGDCGDARRVRHVGSGPCWSTPIPTKAESHAASDRTEDAQCIWADQHPSYPAHIWVIGWVSLI